MIVRCPECSTGFKLPASKISEKGVKLRCSKCSHIFRFRVDAAGEPEIFYADGDLEKQIKTPEPQPQDDAGEDGLGAQSSEIFDTGAEAENDADNEAENEANAEDQDDDDAIEVSGNRTQFGMPAVSMSGGKKPSRGIASTALGAKLSKKLSKSASADYNPFPHANLGTQSPGQTALGIQAPKPAAPVSDPVSTPVSSEEEADKNATDEHAAGASEDPFGGAFADEQGDAAQSQPGAAADEDDLFGDAFADELSDVAADYIEGAGTGPAPGSTLPIPQAPEERAQSSDTTQSASTDYSSASASPGARPEAAPDPDTSGVVDSSGTPGATSHETKLDTTAAEAAAVGAAAGATPFQMRNQAYSAQDMVDSSFGQSGPKFDPERGIVTDDDAAKKPAPSQAAKPVQSRTTNAAAPATQTPATQTPATQQARKPQQADASQQAQIAAPARAAAAWNADPLDDDLIAPHKIGGSGAQKFANFLLIVLLIALGFFALLAGLSGGFIDFKRFSHTLEVAFQGADFQPRAEWSKPAAPQVAPAPENPVRLESVFATPLRFEDSEPIILVRGSARNIDNQTFDDIRLRAMIYDKNERVLTETTAYLGAALQPTQLAEAAADGAGLPGLLPQQASPLNAQSSAPFSLIFEKIPADMLENGEFSYRVEVVDKTPAAGSAALNP